MEVLFVQIMAGTPGSGGVWLNAMTIFYQIIQDVFDLETAMMSMRAMLNRRPIVHTHLQIRLLLV